MRKQCPCASMKLSLCICIENNRVITHHKNRKFNQPIEYQQLLLTTFDRTSYYEALPWASTELTFENAFFRRLATVWFRVGWGAGFFVEVFPNNGRLEYLSVNDQLTYCITLLLCMGVGRVLRYVLMLYDCNTFLATVLFLKRLYLCLKEELTNFNWR